ncbi:DUF4159 domain-containing protein [bacterium]|nr:DUF4159 domain-containing protein [bacterium]
MNRRDFIKSLIGFLVATKLKGIERNKSSLYSIGLLKHNGNYKIRESGIKQILWEVVKRTSIDVTFEIATIDSSNKKELFKSPFCYLSGDGKYSFSKEEIRNIKSFLDFGGFLFIDSAEGVLNGEFHSSTEKLISELYPNLELTIAPKDHVIFRTFNLIDKPFGRWSLDPNFYIIEQGKRVETLYTQNDIAGACSKDLLGNWEYSVSGGDNVREYAFRTMINVVMYSTCLDYKSDQAHIDYLLESRR